MSHSPPPSSSPFDVSNGQPLLGNELANKLANKNDPPVEAEVNDESGSTALLQVLRDALASKTHPPEAVLRATANAARILTRAEGTAIALPVVRGIACRARSGDLAPELGAAVSVSSGISGECLRTSRTLHCADTQNDSRVDAEVCRRLGIRSISVVPLRDGTATFGILEVFSSRIGAFGDEQIRFLKDLAEIAEGAYRLEIRARKMSPVALGLPPEGSSGILAGRRAEPILPPVSPEAAEKPRRRYWLWGTGVGLAILVGAIVWWTWREPIGDTATVEETSQSYKSPSPTTALPSPPKPSPRIAEQKGNRSLLRNAASVETLPGSVAKKQSQSAVQPITRPESTSGSSSVPTVNDPPTVVVASAADNESLTSIASAPSTEPALEVQISQGVTEANLIHKVSRFILPRLDPCGWRDR